MGVPNCVVYAQRLECTRSARVGRASLKRTSLMPSTKLSKDIPSSLQRLSTWCTINSPSFLEEPITWRQAFDDGIDRRVRLSSLRLAHMPDPHMRSGIHRDESLTLRLG